MTKRETMLRRLSAAQFTQWELHLYLESQFGSLTALDATGAEWLKNPWPWDEEECGC